MMRFLIPSSLVTLALVFVTLSTALPARADDNKKDPKITLTVAPVLLLSTNSDANASNPPPPGLTCIGCTKDHPTIDDWQIDYGVSYKISPKFTVSYSHGNVGYQLGRILTIAPGVSFVSGAIFDYTNTAALGYAVGHGVNAHVTWFDHERQDVTGLCLNQKACPDPVTGAEVSNTLSISEHGYTVGGSYDFGFPKAPNGPLFDVAFDVKYLPRPSTAPSPNVIGLGPGLGGLDHWVGSTTVYPWSVTGKIPWPGSKVIPSITYINLPVLYHDAAVPEAYRGIIFGVGVVLTPNVTWSYTNFNLQTCRCIARVPPPDNLRLAFGIMRIDFHVSL
jgi:hypothetical protein